MVNLAQYMDIEELDRYITDLEPSLSAILYVEDDEATGAARRRLGFRDNSLEYTRYPGLKEITTNEVDDIHFRFFYYKTDGNDIWVNL